MEESLEAKNYRREAHSRVSVKLYRRFGIND